MALFRIPNFRVSEMEGGEHETAIAGAIRDAAARGARLAIVGGGSKAGVGAATQTEPLEVSGLSGVVDYDPAELVLTVRPGTRLADVEALVAGQRQMLAFEPFDHGPVFGAAAGAATIGGCVAAGVAGSRRVSAGGARDHLLGLRAVSGRGEPFAAGAKVVKNVTGYDLPKLAAGSWGRLFAITELTLKTPPGPETRATRFVIGLDPAAAVRAMASAMGSQAEVACAAHRPAHAGDPAITALRIEGFAPSVRARGDTLDRLLAAHGRVERAGEGEAAAFWLALRTLSTLPAARDIWRVNVTPSAGAGVVEAMAPLQPDWLMDWAGGLLWVALDSDSDADLVRTAATSAGGHAMLVRASASTRARVGAFQPAAAPLAALEARVRRAFDPAGVFETGRF